MPPPVIKIDRKGAAGFQIGDAAPFDVDLFRFHNERVVIDQQHQDGTGAELPHYIDLLKKYGAPPDITGQEAVEVINKVAELVGDEKKSTETPPSAAGSTSSTAGASSPGSAA